MLLPAEAWNALLQCAIHSQMSNRGQILQWTATVFLQSNKLVAYGIPWSDIRSHFLISTHMKLCYKHCHPCRKWFCKASLLQQYTENNIIFFLFMWNPKLWTESDELISVTKSNTLHTRTYSCITSFYIIMLTWLVSRSELPLLITLKLKNINVLENLKSRQLDEISDLNSHGPTVSEITA
jgi:hypothetical protein